MVAQRLTRQDWLDAAMTSLALEGHESLRAERLAKRLGVSRGSFYWHFQDVAGFERDVLEEWERVAVDLPYAAATADKHNGPSSALRNLIQTVFRSPIALERAVRSWAANSSVAADAVARVDKRRVHLLTGLMALSASPEPEKQTQAVILYWCYLGHVSTDDIPVTGPILDALVRKFCNL